MTKNHFVTPKLEVEFKPKGEGHTYNALVVRLSMDVVEELMAGVNRRYVGEDGDTSISIHVK